MSNKRRVTAWVVGQEAGAPKQHIPGDRARRFPSEEAGKHLWILTAAYSVSDELARRMAAGSHERVLMDSESLLTVQGPGCMWCEKEFSVELANRPCTGDTSR